MKKIIALMLVIMMLFAMLFVCSCKDPDDSDTDTGVADGTDTDVGSEESGGLDHEHTLPKNPEAGAEDDSIINW